MPAAPIAHDRYGHGPTVVLLHPTALGPAMLLPFAQLLSTTHDVIVPHRRGYGRSTGLGPAVGLDDHVDDIEGLLDELGPSSTSTTLVGVSAGATLTLAFGARHPGTDVRLLAHEPLIGPLTPLLHARVAGRIERLLARADRPLELSLFISELVGRPTWNALPAAWRDGVEQNHDAALAEVAFYASFALGATELTQLGRHGLTTSVGVDSGEARQEAAAVLRHHGVATIVVPGSGHLAPVDAPQAFAATIERVEGRSHATVPLTPVGRTTDGGVP